MPWSRVAARLAVKISGEIAEHNEMHNFGIPI
jgi:hypothetical protein